jgi:hypothetical protein
LGGVPAAQLALSSYFAGTACDDSNLIKKVWLRLAASNGDSRAQLMLAKELLSASDEASKGKDVHDLLVASASGTDYYAKKHAAFLLATTVAPGVSDAVAAREIALKWKASIKKAQGELYLTPSHGVGQGGPFDLHVVQFDSPDPEQDIVLAAAYGANGNFKLAAKTQQSAISKAEELDWDMTDLKAMLSAFQENRMPSYANFYLSWPIDKLNAGSAEW